MFVNRSLAATLIGAVLLLPIPSQAQTRMHTPTSSAQALQDMAATLNYSLGAPRAVTPMADGAHVLFLRSGPRDRSQQLYEFTVATGQAQVLLTPADLLQGASEELTVEEKARRERQRQILKGFTSYTLSDDGTQILLPLSGKLYVVRLADKHVTPLPGEGWIDSRFSPDGKSVAGVKDDELFVIDLADSSLTQLTHGASPTLTHGVAEFVAQEEMDRFEGFWWSPDSQTLAYQESDLSDVETLYIPDPMKPDQPPNAFRYPRAGTPNARVRIGLIPRTGGATTWVSWDASKYPYLARVVWREKAAPLTLVVQSRPQREEQVLAVDPQSGATHTLWTEADAAWLNLDSDTLIPRWRADGSGFFWSTERNGDWQLELHDRAGALVRALTPVGFHYAGVADVDEAGQTIVVKGGPDPRETQLYRVPMGGGAPTQISTGQGAHGAVFARDHRLWVDQMSLLDGGVKSVVHDQRSVEVATLPSVAETPPELPRIELTEAVTPDRRFDAVVIRPRDFHHDHKYPVLLSVYAGPTVKEVRASSRSYLMEQWIADQGYIVVSVDGRGTPGHGREWERAVHLNLIDVALDDQVAGLQALGRKYPEMDMTRVGVNGWSFGGYFTAMATMRRPDVFACGVAGAPVTDWAEYDTCYTERYMALPSANPVGYQKASALSYAADLQRPLLLIHGVTDDNVYFVNTLKLTEALFEAGKPFDFLPMTGTHLAGASDPVQQTRLWGRIMEFLNSHLHPME